jgi:hypothetical protein
MSYVICIFYLYLPSLFLFLCYQLAFREVAASNPTCSYNMTGASDAPTLPARTRGRVPLPMLNPRRAEATAAPTSAPPPRMTPSCYAPFLVVVPHRGRMEAAAPLPPLPVDGHELVTRASEAEAEQGGHGPALVPEVTPPGRDCADASAD